MKKLEHKVPNLRFKDFTDDWEQRKLGELFKERAEKSGSGQLLSVSISQGVSPFDESIRKNNSSKDKHNYKVVKINDIAYNSMRMWQGAEGIATVQGIVSPAYTVIIPNSNANPLFFESLFKTSKMLYVFRSHSQGLTSDTWNLKYPLLKKIYVNVPKIHEQEKIANLIRKTEALLSLQQQKLDLLKQLKKGLLQKMFADKDSKRPVLRFKGFHDDWEQRKLGEISDIKSGLSTNTQSKKNLYKITRIETISDGFIDVKKVGTVREKPDKKFLMNCGDILFSNINSLKHIGKVAIFDGSFTLYHGMNLLRITVNTKTSSYFIYYELSTKKYRNWAKAHANPAVSQASINQSELSLENMSLTSLAEQEKIVNLLLLLDKLISLQQQKLAKYQSIKKSLLQQMFI